MTYTSKTQEERWAEYERREREERETKARLRKELEETAYYLAAMLPGGNYTVKMSDPDYAQLACNITDPNGYGLHLLIHYSQYSRKSENGKLSVSLTWGEDHKYATGIREEEPNISVTFARGKEAVWKEINRRVLPDYYKFRSRVRDTKQRELDALATVEGVVREIETRTKGVFRKYEGSLAPYAYHNTQNLTGPSLHQSYVSASHVHLRLDLDHDIAVEVLALVARMKEERVKKTA